MTEERNDGMTETSSTFTVADVVLKTLNGFIELRPHWQMLTLLDFVKGGVEMLRRHIMTDKDITWADPFMQLDYEVKYIEEPPADDDPVRLTKDDARDLSKKVINRIPDFFRLQILEDLTRDVIVRFEEPFTENGRLCNFRYILPPDVETEVAGLPEEERPAKVAELAAGFDFSGISATGDADTPTGKQAFAVALAFTIRPLIVDTIKDRAYYPILVGLNFTEGDPAVWSDEDREALFTETLKGIDGLAAPYLKKGEVRRAVPQPDHAGPIRREDFPVAAGFVPMHRLAERNRGGLLLFPNERRQYFDLRTPLNWAVALALFSFTSEVVPGDWQEVKVADLQDRVFCLTERDAPRHGQQREDILAEVVKLHTAKNAYVRYDWERLGRAWRRTVALGSDYAIPNLELVFIDKRGHRVFPSDPSFQSLAVPLEIKGRRVFDPNGKGIKALPKDRFRLDRIAWRWNPSFADDLKAAPAVDGKGKIKRDVSGKVLRGGFNIRVAVRIFDALTVLRSERAYIAHDLLVLLAQDIYKPPPQSTTAGRNVIEREADRLFDLLGLESDPKQSDRREEIVAAAIYRLKQADIAALLPGSDERPRPPSEAELTSGRRKSPFYRLIRSPDFTPAAALITKEVAKEIEGEIIKEAAEAALSIPAPEVYQIALPGMDKTPKKTIPSGSDIREAREAAGMTLRDFARMVGGPSFGTWSQYETGKPIRVENIKPDTWKKVRDFIAKWTSK